MKQRNAVSIQLANIGTYHTKDIIMKYIVH